MITMSQLSDVLAESQRLGFLGARPVSEVIDHAQAFVSALDGVRGRAVDLGSGGGVPGLVIAQARPDLHLTLVDRRTKRTDFLERVVRRLKLSDSVTVRAVDIDVLIDEIPGSFDAAVARGFGPPARTLAVAVTMVRNGGHIVLSEPPHGDRWTDAILRSSEVQRVPASGGVARFIKDLPAGTP